MILVTQCGGLELLLKKRLLYFTPAAVRISDHNWRKKEIPLLNSEVEVPALQILGGLNF